MMKLLALTLLLSSPAFSADDECAKVKEIEASTHNVIRLHPNYRYDDRAQPYVRNACIILTARRYSDCGVTPETVQVCREFLPANPNEPAEKF